MCSTKGRTPHEPWLPLATGSNISGGATHHMGEFRGFEGGHDEVKSAALDGFDIEADINEPGHDNYVDRAGGLLGHPNHVLPIPVRELRVRENQFWGFRAGELA